MKYFLIFLTTLTNVVYGQYTLALNLQKGNTHSLNINSTTRFEGEMNGRKMAIIATMSGVMRFKVINASDTDYTLETSFDSIKVSLKTPMGKMEFSSGDSSLEGGLGAAPMNTTGNKHCTVTLLKNGAVSKIQNQDTAWFAGMLKNFPMAENIKRLLAMGKSRKTFNHRFMKENFEKFTAIFPNKKVGLNESWGSVIHLDSAGNNDIKINYQLTGYQSGIATISGRRESKSGMQNQKNGMGFPHEMTTETISDLQVNATTGWIKEATIKTTISGNVKQHHDSGGMVPFTIITSTKISGN